MVDAAQLLAPAGEVGARLARAGLEIERRRLDLSSAAGAEVVGKALEAFAIPISRTDPSVRRSLRRVTELPKFPAL
jgi:hypothetical protein